MSKTVDGFKSAQGRPPIYPWTTWMDGAIHKLVKDVDFNGAVRSFQVGAHRTAKNYNLKVHTQIIDDGNGLLLEFYQPKE